MEHENNSQHTSDEVLDYSYLYNEAIRRKSIMEIIKGITFHDICLSVFDIIQGFPKIIFIPLSK